MRGRRERVERCVPSIERRAASTVAATAIQLRNVVFENADIGVVLDGTSFVTVQNVTFTSSRPKSASHPYFGGKGVWMKGAYDCLVRDFHFRARFRYEIVTSYFSVGNV